MYYNQELESGVNVDYLLLLVSRNGSLDIDKFPIKKFFEEEKSLFKKLIAIDGDNFDDIISLLKTLKNKIVNINTSYCINLSGVWEGAGIYINVDEEIAKLTNEKEKIYIDYENFKNNKNDVKQEFNLNENFNRVKDYLFSRVNIWFKAFDIDKAYNEALTIPNVLLGSNRLRGWSRMRNMWKDLEYQLTDDLKMILMTNFGYGESSYFLLKLIFKGVVINSFSEWIDYRYARVSELRHCTKNFAKKYYYKDRNLNGDVIDRIWIDIKNSAWIDAFEYLKDVSNLSVHSEKKFINEFVLPECIKMVDGIEEYFNKSDFDLFDNDNKQRGAPSLEKTKYSFQGFELISFRAEKIIGALDFISSLVEYLDFTQATEVYISKIISINKKFIPQVYVAKDEEKNKLIAVSDKYEEHLKAHTELLEEEKLWNAKKRKEVSLIKFYETYGGKYWDSTIKDYRIFKGEFLIFSEALENSKKIKQKYESSIALHKNNIGEMQQYIEKYNTIIKNDSAVIFDDKYSPIECSNNGVKIIRVEERVSSKGDRFRVVIIEGDVIFKDSENSQVIINSVKVGIPGILSYEDLSQLIGTELPGKIIKESCEPYSLMYKSGREVVLDYRYKYMYTDMYPDYTTKPKDEEDTLPF